MISHLSTLLHDGTTIAATGGLLYCTATATAALRALFARRADHRRDARKVLVLLLRRGNGKDAP
jgi:uncharacterized protein (DUF1501 family)